MGGKTHRDNRCVQTMQLIDKHEIEIETHRKPFIDTQSDRQRDTADGRTRRLRSRKPFFQTRSSLSDNIPVLRFFVLFSLWFID